jgi:hypothetical protein
LLFRLERFTTTTAGVVDRPKNFSPVAAHVYHMVGERLRAPERSS